MSVTHYITGGSVHLSQNPIQVVLTASATRLNHKLALKVTCTTLQNVLLLGAPQIEEIAPKDLISVFEISGICQYAAYYNFTFPDTGISNPHDWLAIKVTLDIGEVWTDETGARQESWNNLSSNNVIRVLNGKLRPYELALLTESGSSFAEEYINGGKFLTHLPNNIKVAPNQVPMLWYLSRWATNHEVTIHLKVNTATKVAHFPIEQTITLYSTTGLIEFAINPTLWGFVPDPNEEITSYEFWITDADGEVSERRTFVVDNNYYERNYFLYYVNPLSGVDNIWLRGSYLAGVKTESETAYKPVSVGAFTNEPTLITVSASGQPYWEINTGTISRDELQKYRDFLEAKDRWMVDPANSNKLIPVYIESGDFTLDNSESDFLPNLTIKIFEAHK